MKRHGNRVPKLNKAADQRKALLRSLTTEVIRHGRITTTTARAKVRIARYFTLILSVFKLYSGQIRHEALSIKCLNHKLCHRLYASMLTRWLVLAKTDLFMQEDKLLLGCMIRNLLLHYLNRLQKDMLTGMVVTLEFWEQCLAKETTQKCRSSNSSKLLLPSSCSWTWIVAYWSVF